MSRALLSGTLGSPWPRSASGGSPPPAASDRKATTRENYATIARTHLAAEPFGSLTLDRLRPSDVEALLAAKRDAGLAASTRRTIYTVLRAVLDTAVRDGLVARNAAAAVRRPSPERTESRYLTASDVGTLLAATADDRLAALYVLLVGTRLRRGEALALGLHTLRHSAATALIASGAHMRVVQELLGHSSFAITADVYAHVAPESTREAADRLAEAFAW